MKKIIILLAVSLWILGGCTPRSHSQDQPQQFPSQPQPQAPASSQGEDSPQGVAWIPLPTGDSAPWLQQGEAWRGQTLYFTDSSRLLAAIITGEHKVELMALDLRDSTWEPAFTLDTDYIGHMTGDGEELVITTSEAIRVISLPQFTPLLTTENIGRDWGANTVHGLSADRDDRGIVIQSYLDPTLSIRVAEQTDDVLYDGPYWSPDGGYLKYSRYHGGFGKPIDLCVADSQGDAVCEFAFPEYDYSAYWSDNSRNIIFIASQELGGALRVLDVETGRQISEIQDPYADCFRDYKAIHETTVAAWREVDEGNYILYVFDAVTGASTDLLEVEALGEMAFSPDGTVLAFLPWESPRQIALLDPNA